MTTAAPQAFAARTGDVEVAVERYNGRQQIVIRNARWGGRVVVPLGDGANVAGLVDRAVTHAFAEEARPR